MHSSRMRTVRCSDRLEWGGVYLGMGCLPRGGVCLGVSAQGVHTSPVHCMLGYTHPRGQTDACENTTLPQISFAGGNKALLTRNSFSSVLSAAPLIFFTFCNIMREHHHRNSFNPFWNGEKNGAENVTYKPGLNVKISKAFAHFRFRSVWIALKSIFVF